LEKLTQILFNLLSNAIKFTKFGFINLKVKFDYINSKLIFNIFDSGIGIKEESIKNIFKPFFKSKDNKNNIYGMGLGLYIVKLHIESLNGEIVVKSKESKNTHVNFYIITENHDKLKKSEIGSNMIPKIDDEELEGSIKTSKNVIFNTSRKVCDLIENENKRLSNANLNVKNKSNINEENNLCFKNTNLSKLKNSYISDIETHRIHQNEKNIYPEISINNNNISNIQRCSIYLKDKLNLNPFLDKESEIYENTNNINKIFKGSSEILKFKNLKSLFCNNQEKLLENLYSEDNLYKNKGEKQFNIYHTIISQKFETDNLLLNRPKRLIARINSNTDYAMNFYKRNKSLKFEYPELLNKDTILITPENYFNNYKINEKMRCKTHYLPNQRDDLEETYKINSNKNSLLKHLNEQQIKNLVNSTDNQNNEISNETISIDRGFQFNYKNFKNSNDINKNFNYNVNDTNSESNYSYFIGTPEINKRILNTIRSNPQNKSNEIRIKNSNPKLNDTSKKENILSKLYNFDKDFYPNIQKNNELNLIGENKINKSELIFKDSQITIIVVDDEKLIRQSNINLIKKYFKNKSIIYQVFECEDGFSCLNVIYQAKLVGKEIDYIITDQTMNHITGTLLSEIIGLLVEHKIINNIKMYLLTSYSANLFNKQENRFIKVFSKPFRLEYLELIFKEISA